MVASADALAAAVEALGGYAHGLYAERWAPFTKVCTGMLCGSAGACQSQLCRGRLCTWPVRRALGAICQGAHRHAVFALLVVLVESTALRMAPSTLISRIYFALLAFQCPMRLTSLLWRVATQIVRTVESNSLSVACNDWQHWVARVRMSKMALGFIPGTPLP